MQVAIAEPNTPNWRRYSTGLWTIDDSTSPKPPYRGRGWAIGVRLYRCDGDLNTTVERLIELFGFVPHSGALDKAPDGTSRWTSSPEIFLLAPNREKAQQGANLLFAAMLLLHGKSLFHDSVVTVPEDPEERAKYHPTEIHRDYKFSTQPHLMTASALAARLSTRRSWQHAALKYAASLRICSVPFMSTHPTEGHTFGVEADPANRVAFAQAIVAGYAVVEELGLHIRASPEKPSFIDGKWNPVVKEELQARLIKGRVDLSDTQTWIVRGPPTKLERKRPLPQGEPASWSGGAVRDRHLHLVDAIARASWLRSKVSAHGFSELSASLTVIDVSNVQFLARRLVLENTGFWRRLEH